MCLFVGHLQEISRLETEIYALKCQLRAARNEIEQHKLAYAALEQTVKSKLGCRYTGDAAVQVERAARALLRYEEARSEISAAKTRKNYRAVQCLADEYGDTWNTVLRQKAKEAEQLKVENARLNRG